MKSFSSSQNNFQSSINNLIQNFYIIGYSPNDFFNYNEQDKSGIFADIFKERIEDIPILKPKIITKFPNINTINTISDDIILNHCFPDEILKIFTFKKSKDDNYPKTFFQFTLENIPQNYQNDDKKFYTKIYFSCLEVGESLSKYFDYKNEIINLFKNKGINLENEKEKIKSDEKFSHFMIPKVLCFASVLPYYNELRLLLKNIYEYYLSRKDFSSLPLEKIIEKIILTTPIPLKPEEELLINFDISSFKEKIHFPICNINEININYNADMPLNDIFKYFSIDDIIRIFKYIIFEIPLLFFSNDKSILSLFIDTFLTVLSPFKYVLPHVSILPKKCYGLINSEPTFIFGINEQYDENFFVKNNIELDKIIVVVSIQVDKIKKIATVKLEDKMHDSQNMKKYIIERRGFSKKSSDYIYIDKNKIAKINVDIPNIHKKILYEGINKYISFMKKRSIFSKKETPPKDLTYKIQKIFYKFFVNILGGYTEYLSKSPSFYTNPKNIGENMYFKNDRSFLKEVFIIEDFISKVQKDFMGFYYIFFNTKLFINFFHERFYNNNIINQLSLKQFDQLTFLKNNNESRKKKENKTLYENFQKDISDKIKIDKKYEINLTDDNTSSNKDILSLAADEVKNQDILLNYGQLIKLKSQKDKNEKIDIKYCIFPKLMFEYLDNKNNKLTFLNNNYISNFKSICLSKKEEIEKLRPYAFYEKIFEIIDFTDGEKKYEVTQIIYINYIWLILLSCSLWYCEPEEKKYRLDKLFEIINKMENFEEYVLNILYINLYKYGDKFHFIKLYILYGKVIRYVNYYFLYLLIDKVKEKDYDLIENKEENKEENTEENKEEKNKEIEQNDLILTKRYLIKLSNEFIKKRKKRLSKSSFKQEDNEEIIFLTEQLCQKCNKKSDIKPLEIINNKTNLIDENYKYICPLCKAENQDIIIKYQMSLSNYLNKEAFISEIGEFKMLTQYKLYKDLKQYLSEVNDTKLDINNIFDIKEKINLINIIFYFSLFKLSFDFLFPYVEKLSSKNLNFENMENQKSINKEKDIKEPIKITYKEKDDEVTFVNRKFNLISPKYNLKKKKSFLGIEYGTVFIETETSFTIKNSKKTVKKKK